MSDFCMAVDVGNTRSSAAVVSRRKVLAALHVPTARREASEIRAVVKTLAGRFAVRGAVLCSVVPGVNSLWGSALKRQFGVAPVIVSHRLNLGFKVAYPKPSTLGADRLANIAAVAGRHAEPVIVADFGTASTFDVLTADKTYIGGVIAPGPSLMTEYLADRTALLPRIRAAGEVGCVGRSTVGAMRIGARIGYRGMIKEIIQHLMACLGSRTARLYATGGYSAQAVRETGLPFRVDPHLTFLGLRRIYELNQPRPPE